MYSGGIEVNLPKVKSGAKTFIGSDGAEHQLQAWPKEVDGLRIYYMEKPGKHFLAVRIQDTKDDLVLTNPLLIEPSKHMGHGKRFSAEPTIIDDDMAVGILADALTRNPHQREPLKAMRDRIAKATGKFHM